METGYLCLLVAVILTYTVHKADTQTSCYFTLTATPRENTLATTFKPELSQSSTHVCQWRIKSQHSTKRIALRVLHSNLRHYCNDENVSVYDGDVESHDRYLGQWCGKLTKDFKSVSSSMLLVYTSHVTNTNGSGFSAVYKEETCLYLLEATTYTRHLSTPGYPDKFHGKFECTWHIRSLAGERILLRIVKMDVPCSDRVTIMSRDRLWSLCGTSHYAYLLPETVSVRLSVSSNLGKGFEIEYSTYYGNGFYNNVTELQATTHVQEIRSPGYPTVFLNNMRCGWRLTSPTKDTKIKLEISPTFQRVCSRKNYLTVFDGYNATDAPTYICGWKNTTLISSGRVLLMYLITDSENSDLAFKVSYTSIKETVPKLSSDNTGAIVGGVVGTILVIIIFAVCVVRLKIRSKNIPSQPVEPQVSIQHTAPYVIGGLEQRLPQGPPLEQSPPSYYNSVWKQDLPSQPPPPSYEEAVNMQMLDMQTDS